MKRTIIVFSILLWMVPTVMSQSVRMEVSNESLNRVLRMLDMEIAFDDQALSAYSVSVSRMFETKENALSWLLNDTPFRIEKIGTVYVIVPDNDKQHDQPYVAIQHTNEEKFVFRGTVTAQTTGEPLEYATVSLLNADSTLLTSGIATAQGQFVIRTSRIPSRIKISYIGYETMVRDVHNLNGELGDFALEETAIQLNEAIITADNIRQGISHETFVVTPQMRIGAMNAQELSEKIPGVRFDQTSNTLQLNYQTNILLLVDGVQHSPEYLKYLSPNRIQSIDVVYALSGRHVSDDYAGIIQFKLNRNYAGYDFFVSNATSFNLSQTAGGNRLTKNHPSAGFIYTTRHLNFFGIYEYDRENRPLHSSQSLMYGLSEFVSIPANRPNNVYEQENHRLNGGLTYQLTPLQQVGVQADFTAGRTSSFQEYVMQQTGLDRHTRQTLTNTTDNRVKANSFTGMVFYRGQATNRLHLNGDFSFHYYYNDMENEFQQVDVTNYRYTDLWNEYKNQTTLNVDAKYLLSEKMSVEAGYSNIWRQYASTSSHGIGFLDYNEHRNKAFSYLTWHLSDKTGLKSGVAIEHIRQRDAENEKTYVRLLPYVRINHRINPSATVAVSYTTGQSYPLLHQLSPMNIVIDNYLTQIGNPALETPVRHIAFAELTLWNKVRIMPQFVYTGSGIGEVYDMKANKLYRTFENMTFRAYSLHASCYHTFGNSFTFKNSVMRYRNEALYAGVANSLNGWLFHSEADYYHPQSSVGVQIGYYRNMRKNILWQGYQMSDRDYWSITARKELWYNRISVMLSYIPPLSFGVRYNSVKEMDAPHYKEKTTVNMESYHQMLLLKVSMRLDRGGKKFTESQVFERER